MITIHKSKLYGSLIFAPTKIIFKSYSERAGVEGNKCCSSTHKNIAKFRKTIGPFSCTQFVVKVFKNLQMRWNFVLKSIWDQTW